MKIDFLAKIRRRLDRAEQHSYTAAMALNCGIVGLPNVGKSTIFKALSGCNAEAANYPFCTINPNTGIVEVSDERLIKLSAFFAPQRTIPCTVEFVDIAGLVKGASSGEGMGNKFLSHIRETALLVQVVRCFDDSNIVHVNNKVDPVSDMDTIAAELALADLETLAKRKEKAERALKVQDKAQQKEATLTLEALAKIEALLQEGKAARNAALSDAERDVVRDVGLITLKPALFVCNVNEKEARTIAAGGEASPYVKAVRERAKAEGTEALVLCGKFEAELVDLDKEMRAEFLREAGLKESGLSNLARSAYSLLGLITFFTAGKDECRAWTVRKGDAAPSAAGVIHSDFEKGFIKAEVYSFADFEKYGTEAKIREAGKYRVEGREYVVEDGDIMFFKFNAH